MHRTLSGYDMAFLVGVFVHVSALGYLCVLRGLASHRYWHCSACRNYVVCMSVCVCAGACLHAPVQASKPILSMPGACICVSVCVCAGACLHAPVQASKLIFLPMPCVFVCAGTCLHAPVPASKLIFCPTPGACGCVSVYVQVFASMLRCLQPDAKKTVLREAMDLVLPMLVSTETGAHTSLSSRTSTPLKQQAQQKGVCVSMCVHIAYAHTALSSRTSTPLKQEAQQKVGRLHVLFTCMVVCGS